MRQRLDIPFTLAALPLFVLSACDAQVDPDYPGEPIASLVGTVTNEMQSRSATDPVVVLLWMNENTPGGPDTFYGETAAVSGQFPADFTLDVFTPPPDFVLNDFTAGGQRPDESRVGTAAIAVVDGQAIAAFERGEEPAADALLGGADKHVLVYVDKDIQPGTFGEYFLDGQLSAGFHVMDVERLTEAQQQQVDQCRAQAVDEAQRRACGPDSAFDRLHLAPADMQTRISVRLVDDPDSVDWPEWT
jgi:hypothetical protein